MVCRPHQYIIAGMALPTVNYPGFGKGIPDYSMARSRYLEKAAYRLQEATRSNYGQSYGTQTYTLGNTKVTTYTGLSTDYRATNYTIKPSKIYATIEQNSDQIIQSTTTTTRAGDAHTIVFDTEVKQEMPQRTESKQKKAELARRIMHELEK